MSGPHLLAIDAGTGSCRAVLFDDQARQVGVSLREWAHRETPGVPGGQDFDVERSWQLIAACVAEVLAASGTAASDVAAVATTSMREGIVLYDAAGAEIWACPNVDGRANAEAAELVASGAADKIYRQSGDWVSITSPARLRWIACHAPHVLAATASLGLLSDWITYRLCGVHVTEPSCGSSSGMFDLSTRAWSHDIAALCGLPAAALPPVYEPGTVVGTVTPAAAAVTGLAAGTPVTTGGADTQLGLAGAGLRVGDFAVVAGTFWQTAILLDSPTVDPGRRLRTLCHVEPGQWMLEGIGFYSGMAMRWFRDSFCAAEIEEAARRGIDPYTVMEERAATVPAGSLGVLAILSNVMDAARWVHASPSLVGFDLSNPGTGLRASIRAIEEAGAYVARAHRDIITGVTGLTVPRIVFTGGAAKGALWPQIIADVLAAEVEIPAVTESSARGAAVAAGVGVGMFGSLGDAPGLRDRSRTVTPRAGDVAVYDEAYAHWRTAYDRLLQISEEGVLTPLWRSAGADAPRPSRTTPTS